MSPSFPKQLQLVQVKAIVTNNHYRSLIRPKSRGVLIFYLQAKLPNNRLMRSHIFRM